MNKRVKQELIKAGISYLFITTSLTIMLLYGLLHATTIIF